MGVAEEEIVDRKLAPVCKSQTGSRLLTTILLQSSSNASTSSIRTTNARARSPLPRARCGIDSTPETNTTTNPKVHLRDPGHRSETMRPAERMFACTAFPTCMYPSCEYPTRTARPTNTHQRHNGRSQRFYRLLRPSSTPLSTPPLLALLFDRNSPFSIVFRRYHCREACCINWLWH